MIPLLDPQTRAAACRSSVAALLMYACVGFVGSEPATADDAPVVPNYQAASRFSASSLGPFLYDTDVRPNWIGKTDQFWYSYRTSAGTAYVRINPKMGIREALFDREKLCSLLSAELHKPVDPVAMPISRLEVNDEGAKLKFVADDFQYEFDFHGETLKKLGKAPPAPAAGLGRPGLGRRGGGEGEGGRLGFGVLNRDVEEQQRRDDEQDQQHDGEQGTQNQQATRNQQRTAPGNGPRGAGDYRNFSPDRKNYVFVQKFNLFYADAGAEEKAIALTKDGVEDYTFGFRGFGGGRGNGIGNRNNNGTGTGNGTTQTGTGTTGTGTGTNQTGTSTTSTSTGTSTGTSTVTTGTGGRGQERGRTDGAAATPDPNAKSRAGAVWSSDSKAFYVSRSDGRGVKELFVINSLAEPRPTLEKYKYPMPGEQETRRTELHVFVRATKSLKRVPTKWKDESYSNIHWGKTSGELRFLRRDRLNRHVELCAMSVDTGEVKTLISDGFENANVASQPVRYLDETGEMLWWSERSGWGHYYLYSADGKLKNAVTAGQFRVSNIVDVDPKNRILYFVGNGREVGENPYYQHLYSAHLDGTGMTLLDPGRGSHRSRLSPSRQFVVDNVSAVDVIPSSVLRHADGREVMPLETADVSRLTESGWKLPETFVVKAADGVTDLYGNLWKPFDFDSKRKYPIILHVYPGPQQEGTTHTFSAASGEQQLAQLGFIVIQVGHRGGTPARSKAYHSYGYFNLRDYGLADKKAAVEQLAARHAYIDIDRVGLYGHSGGGFMTAAAMLQKPYNEFFKVGVSTSGNHDNNIYGADWAETYHGLKEVVEGEKSESANQRTQTRARASNNSAASLDDEGESTKLVAEDRLISETEGAETEDPTLDEPFAAVDDAKKADDKKADATKDGSSKAEVKKAEDKKADATKDGSSKAEVKKADDKKDGAKQTTAEAKKSEEKMTHFEIHVPTNAELAQNLRGRLLLIHGELDNNVHPANTLRLVDALIKANKRFDMLYLPGKRHAYADYQPYVNQRMMEYFAENLLGDYQPGADINEKARGAARR